MTLTGGLVVLVLILLVVCGILFAIMRGKKERIDLMQDRIEVLAKEKFLAVQDTNLLVSYMRDRQRLKKIKDSELTELQGASGEKRHKVVISVLDRIYS